MVARDVQEAVSSRVFGLLGPLGWPVRPIHRAISSISYRAVAGALRAPLEASGRSIAQRIGPEAPALADSPVGGFALAALNGFAGDRLAARHGDLAVKLSVRRRGRDVALDEESVAAAFPDAAPRIAVFLHGLCENDEAWLLRLPGSAKPRPPYGERLREELGYCPVYVRYNTGLHVSDNGRRLAETLERLADVWPVDVEEIALFGHSMGGLVVRSACRHGELADHTWVGGVRHVFCLGTPHLGAPLEKAANLAGWTLGRLPETRPFGDLFFNGRSAGIKDLRFGNCVEEDWCDCDPDELLRDRCTEVPFLPNAAYYFVGATLSRRPSGVGALVGDLLVTYASASGHGRRRRIPFEVENGGHVGGLDHIRLLNHPAVYAQIRKWLERAVPEEAM